MMTKLLFFPFSGNTKEAVSVVEAINETDSRWELLGFLDDDSDLWGRDFLGYEVLGGKDKLPRDGTAKILAAPGRPENYHRRDLLIRSLNLSEDSYATLVHPSAQISSDTVIGYNTLIMAGVVTTANVQIGNHCVVLPNTVISHDSTVDDFCLIGSNVSISGGVHIESQSYIGSGAKIIQEITIKEKSLIGLGSVVLKSTDPGSIVAGNPAKRIRTVS